MGKRIDELKLDDSPIIEEPDKPDDRDTAWYQFVGAIDDLLATGLYDWALDTLSGIRDTVEKSRRVTDGQKRAVTNIERSQEEKYRSRRRYEGWEKRSGW